MGEKLVFVVTSAEEQPERATVPFVLANAALAMDVEAIVVLQTMGVYLGMKGYARHVHAAGFPPLQDLIESFQEGGGKIYVCDPCIQSKGRGLWRGRPWWTPFWMQKMWPCIDACPGKE
jgi:predicted peroxiredoxin